MTEIPNYTVYPDLVQFTREGLCVDIFSRNMYIDESSLLKLIFAHPARELDFEKYQMVPYDKNSSILIGPNYIDLELMHSLVDVQLCLVNILKWTPQRWHVE